MTSDEERREVAKRLRSKKPAEFGEPLVRSVFRHVFRSLYPKQIYPVSNWVLRMPYALADLIDRPTCTMTYKPEWSDDEIYPTSAYQCSNCGSVVNEGITEFCPSCGCMVSNFETEPER